VGVLEPVQARRERVLIGGGPACGGGAPPIVERTIELQPVGRDDGKAREQERLPDDGTSRVRRGTFC